eukprot:TRINITY_DN9002_c0_g1_i1.p1 TRINITY_DN9002_c0_g1~~TRINITY_DN9002_c0_g1_i1.p1  ORF type:complete len:1504 (+),score=222.72 TRINITY_DN9002_c0_g1_i1:71-4582(+)
MNSVKNTPANRPLRRLRNLKHFSETLSRFRQILLRWDLLLMALLTFASLLSVAIVSTVIATTSYDRLRSTGILPYVITMVCFVPFFLLAGTYVVFLARSYSRRSQFLFSLPTVLLPLGFVFHMFSSRQRVDEYTSNTVTATLLTVSFLLILAYGFWSFLIHVRTSSMGQRAITFARIPYVPLLILLCCCGVAFPISIIIPLWLLYASDQSSSEDVTQGGNESDGPHELQSVKDGLSVLLASDLKVAALYLVVPYYLAVSIMVNFIYLNSYANRIPSQVWPLHSIASRIAAAAIHFSFFLALASGIGLLWMDDDHPTETYYALGTLAIAFPLMSCVGFYFAASHLRIEDKITLAAVIGVELPLILSLHFRNVWIDTDYVIIPNLVLFSALLQTGAWTLLSLFRHRRFTIPHLLYSSSATILCFLFPLGYLLPLLVYSDTIHDIEPFALATSLLVPVAVMAYIFVRIVHFIFRTALMIHNQQLNFSSADVNYWSNWTTRVGLFISTLCYVLVFFLIPLKDGGAAVLLSLWCGAPAFVLLGTALANARGYQKFVVSGLILLVIPLCIFLPLLLYVDLESLDQIHYVLLTLTIGGPLSCVFWFLLWIVKDVFSSNYVFSPTFAFCCWCLFIPFGVGVPIFFQINIFHVSVAIISGIGLGLVSAICVFSVSVISIGLNIHFKHIEAERKCRIALSALRIDLARINVRSDEEPLLMIYNNYVKNGPQSCGEWLVSEKDITSENIKSLLRIVFTPDYIDSHKVNGNSSAQLEPAEQDEQPETVDYDTRLWDYCCSSEQKRLEPLGLTFSDDIVAVSIQVVSQAHSPAHLRWKAAVKVLKKQMEGIWIFVRGRELADIRLQNNRLALEQIYEYYASLDRAVGLDDRRFRFLFVNAKLSRDEFWAFCRDCKLVDFLPHDAIDFIFSQQATYAKMQANYKAKQDDDVLSGSLPLYHRNEDKIELSFRSFLDAVQALAEHVYPYEDSSDAFEMFMKIHVLHRIPLLIGSRWDSTKPRLGLSIHDLIKRVGVRIRKKSPVRTFALADPDCCVQFVDKFSSMWRPAPIDKKITEEIISLDVQPTIEGLPESWSFVVQAIMESLGKNANRTDKIDILLNLSNPSNLFALGLLAIEFLTLISTSLHIAKEPRWGFEQWVSVAYNFILVDMLRSSGDGTEREEQDLKEGHNPSMFLVAVAVSFILAILFPPFSYPGIRQAQDGSLGKTKDGKLPPVLSMAFVYLKCLNLLGSTLYTVIMKTLISTTSCTIAYRTISTGDGTIEEQEILLLDGNPGIDCWTREHIPYVAIGGIGIIFYYPVATFLYPNLQFQDQALDIKFDPTFVVIFAQASLIYAGAAAYFTTYPNVMLLLAAILYGVMAIVNQKMQPCLVGSINKWRTLVLLMTSYTALCSLFVYNGAPIMLMYIILLFGWVAACYRIYSQREIFFAHTKNPAQSQSQSHSATQSATQSPTGSSADIAASSTDPNPIMQSPSAKSLISRTMMTRRATDPSLYKLNSGS